MNRTVLVCHCILNQSTRAWWKTGGASRVDGLMEDVILLLARYSVGVIQMDCPEYSLYGNPRPPRSKDGYDIPAFRERCSEIATRAVDTIEGMESNEDYHTRVLAVIGMEGSPSCGVERTNHTIRGETHRVSGQGHLIEAIRDVLAERGLDVPIIGVSLRQGEKESQLEKLEVLLQVSMPLSK